MINYIELILSGVLWIGFTWIVARDIFEFSDKPDSKYREINRKIFPMMLIAMVYFGSNFWIHMHTLAS